MSCQLKKLFSLHENLPNLQNILFVKDFKTSELDADIQRESWEEALREEVAKSSSLIQSSLSDCFIAISPFVDLLVFACHNNVAVYRFKEDTPSRLYGTTLYELEPGERITAVACLPFVSQQLSNQGGLDWTCIILGFNSGCIRIYTENMSLLISQRLFNEPITCIKIQSFFSAYTSGRTYQIDCPKHADEIFIFFKSVCLMIEGFTFYQTLRSCRNFLARNIGQSFSDAHSIPNFALRFKKWKFKRFGKILDCDNCGLHEVNAYDHLVSRSISNFSAGNFRNRTRQGNLIISTGEDPFFNVLRTDDSDSSTILDEVTSAVVNKVKNILPGFLRTSERQGPKFEPSLEFCDTLELWDQYRIGQSITLSPSRDLAAVTDNFGRILLVSVADKLVVRMWKGYREAQLGWIESSETPEDLYSKKVQFLCIYAPKRGLLEIWRCQHGVRVEAFNVGKSCRLFYCGFSMIGMNDVLHNQFRNNGSLLCPKTFCYLFDVDSCTLSEIHVPFVCSLTEGFSQQKKDILLLKEFKNIAQSQEYDEKNVKTSQVINLFDQVKSHEIKMEAINYVINLPNPFLVKSLCSNFTKELPFKLTAKMDPNIVNIALKCRWIDHLCKLYDDFSFLNTAAKKVKLFNSIHQNPPEFDSQSQLLDWEVSDFVKCVSLFSFKESVFVNFFKELAPSDISLAEFILFFNLDDRSSTEIDIEPTNLWIVLKKPEKDFYKLSDLSKLGYFFLFPAIDDENVQECSSTLQACRVTSSDLLYTLFASWLDCDISSNWENWAKFYRYVTQLVLKLKKNHSVDQENWRSILKIISHMIGQSNNITSALVAALILRTVYSKFTALERSNLFETKEEKDVEMEDSAGLSSEEWEDISEEREKLSLLVTQLQDCLFLSVTLRCNPAYDPGPISLISLLRSHPGVISESVAKWIISYPIEPLIILSLNDIQLEDEVKDPSELCFGIDIVKIGDENYLGHDVIKQLLRTVRDHFPNSMESDIVFANCTWESLTLWNKDMTANSSYLLLALKYLSPISSAVLKHAIGCLMWKTFILKRFETLAHLMEKMGKTPKERILQRDVGIDEKALVLFVDFVTDLLDTIIDTLSRADTEGMPLYRMDEWWKHRICSNSQLPLVFIAIQQRPAQPELILQIFSLASVISLMVHFNIKNFRPLSLFPNDVRSMLFGEIFLSLKNDTVDSVLNQQRSKFLMAVATAVAQSVPSFIPSEDDRPRIHSQANRWLNKVVTLSKDWRLDADEVRRRYVCELYTNECDSLADEVINMVHDREKLAEEMIKIAGLRISKAMKLHGETLISSLPPNTVVWLQNLYKSDSSSLSIDFQATRLMLEYIQVFLSEDHSGQKTASDLLSIVKKLSS